VVYNKIEKEGRRAWERGYTTKKGKKVPSIQLSGPETRERLERYGRVKRKLCTEGQKKGDGHFT